MATIKHFIKDKFEDDELNLKSPIEYVEFDEPLSKYILIDFLEGIFGDTFFHYKDDNNIQFILSEKDVDIINSLWSRNEGPLRIYKRTENRLGQKDFKCNEGQPYDCSKCLHILQFKDFDGTDGLYYCTLCEKDKWK